MGWGAQTGKNADKVKPMRPMGKHTTKEIRKHNEETKGRQDKRDIDDDADLWFGTKKKGWFD